MPTLKIEGRRVKVDDAFMQLSPEDQAKTVDEIAVQMGIHPQQQADPSNQGLPESQQSQDLRRQLSDMTQNPKQALDNQTPVLADMVKGGLSGIRQGLESSAGFIGDAAERQADLTKWLVKQAGGSEKMADTAWSIARRLSPMPFANSTNDIQQNLTNPVAGEAYQAKTIPGQYAQTAGQFLPGVVGGEGSLGQKLVTQVAIPAVMSETAGQVTKGTGFEPVARIAGGIIGGMLPAARAPIANIMNDRNAIQQAAKEAEAGPETLKMLQTVMQSDGTLGPVGRANMAAAGKDAMLADAGPNAKAILDTSIQRGGPGAVSARQAIENRVATGSEDLMNVLDSTLGQAEGIATARQGIKDSTSAARSATYDAAYEMPINYSDPRGQFLEEVIKKRVPPAAIRKANEMMRTEGLQSKQILAKIAPDGSISYERLPDVRQIDYITRALKDVARETDGKGALGGKTDLGRAYENLSSAIRNTTKKLVPEYGTALDTASDAISRSKAVELGGKLLSPSMAMDEVKMAVADMGQAERDAVAQGIRSRIDNVMANVTRTVQDGNVDAREAIKGLKDLSSRASREKVAAAIGQEKASALFDELDRIAKTFELRASVAENSKTYARQAVDRRVRQVTDPGAIGLLRQGKPYAAGKHLLSQITAMSPEQIQSRQDAIYSQLSEILTRSPDRSKNVFNALEKFATQQGLNKAEARKIVAKAMVATPKNAAISLGAAQARN